MAVVKLRVPPESTSVFMDNTSPYICICFTPLSSVQCDVPDILSPSLPLNLPESWKVNFFFINRSGIFLDLQWVPDLREAGHPPLYLTGDGEPVHRQSGALRRWQLHLCGDKHSHQDPSSGSTHTTSAPQWRWATAMNMQLTCAVM